MNLFKQTTLDKWYLNKNKCDQTFNNEEKIKESQSFNNSEINLQEYTRKCLQHWSLDSPGSLSSIIFLIYKGFPVNVFIVQKYLINAIKNQFFSLIQSDAHKLESILPIYYRLLYFINSYNSQQNSNYISSLYPSMEWSNFCETLLDLLTVQKVFIISYPSPDSSYQTRLKFNIFLLNYMINTFLMSSFYPTPYRIIYVFVDLTLDIIASIQTSSPFFHLFLSVINHVSSKTSLSNYQYFSFEPEKLSNQLRYHIRYFPISHLDLIIPAISNLECRINVLLSLIYQDVFKKPCPSLSSPIFPGLIHIALSFSQIYSQNPSTNIDSLTRYQNDLSLSSSNTFSDISLQKKFHFYFKHLLQAIYSLSFSFPSFSSLNSFKEFEQLCRERILS